MQPRNPVLLLLFLFLWACKKSDPSYVNTIPKGDAVPLVEHLRLDTNSGVCIGNSIIAGHPWHYSGLELGIQNYPDSFGQISWHLTRLTHFKWINHGWTGQTTAQIRARFLRDAIGDTSDPGDGRGAVSLAARPNYVVMEGGVNDIRYQVPLDSIEANLAWMASTCKQNRVHCIVLNSIGWGYFGFDSTQTAMIGELNHWLASGVLDSVQAIVVDINSLWNSGTYGGISPYGNDNIHFSSLVCWDEIHFTEAGYDSVAHAIYRVAKLAPLYDDIH